MNGLQLIKKIRRRNKKVPIIVVTAFLEIEYLLEAVELHLVKYVIKPLTNQKLDVALTLAHKYLEEDTQQSTLHLTKTLIYDSLNQTLISNHQVIYLTRNEKLLFHLLVSDLNNVIPYNEIEATIWQYESMCIDSLRSLLRTLRKKLEGVSIKNVSGIGYKLLVGDFDYPI